jgi:hypothetical protein
MKWNGYDCELKGEIRDIEIIAEGHGIRELQRLQEGYPSGKNWRKKKGFVYL